MMYYPGVLITHSAVGEQLMYIMHTLMLHFIKYMYIAIWKL